MGGLLLNRVLRLHIQLLGHLVAIVGKKIVVERFVVASDAPPDARGVGGENRGDLRQMMVDIQQSEARHPFVGVINDF